MEDTTVTPGEIARLFGQPVLELVDRVTRKEPRPRAGDQLGDPYFRHIVDSGVGCILIKIADKIDNVRDALTHPNQDKRRLYVRECQTVFLPLVNYLQDAVLEKKVLILLEEAIGNHFLRSDG